MDKASLPDREPRAELSAGREVRLARETLDIEKARASAASGHVVDSVAVKAWIDSIGTDRELPVPYASR